MAQALVPESHFGPRSGSRWRQIQAVGLECEPGREAGVQGEQGPQPEEEPQA